MKPLFFWLFAAPLLAGCGLFDVDAVRPDGFFPLHVTNVWRYEVTDAEGRPAGREDHLLLGNRRLDGRVWAEVTVLETLPSGAPGQRATFLRNRPDGVVALEAGADGAARSGFFYRHPVADGERYDFTGHDGRRYEMRTRRTSVTVPAGRFDCTLYETTLADGLHAACLVEDVGVVWAETPPGRRRALTSFCPKCRG